MKKKILIIYAPYGSGHKSIANYIGNYFTKYSKDYEIKVLDVAKYANRVGRISVKLFDYVIRKRKNLSFSAVYDLADSKIGTLNQMYNARKGFDNEQLRKEIVDFNPDLTISTHFFGGNMVMYYNKLGLTHSKILSVVTDYISHAYWRKYDENQVAYVVANELVKNHMIKKGIAKDKVYAYGLPLDQEKFSNVLAKDEVYKKYNVDKSKKTSLFFAGGSAGSTKNFTYLKKFAKENFPINIIFVCGKNEVLEKKCQDYINENNIKNIIVLGFVTDVYNLLSISDLVISKPGGATITECMDMKVPMIVIPGNGGPEKYNARFVVNKGFGKRCHNASGVCKAINEILSNEKLYNSFKEVLLKEKKNESAKKIYELSVKILEK